MRIIFFASSISVTQVALYAEFDRSKLLPFLKKSNYYPLQKVIVQCLRLIVQL